MPIVAEWYLQLKEETEIDPRMLGYNTHGLLFSCLRKVDPVLGNEMHKNDRIRPFSLCFPNLYENNSKNIDTIENAMQGDKKGRLTIRIGMTNDIMAIKLLQDLNRIKDDLRLGAIPVSNEGTKIVKEFSIDQVKEDADSQRHIEKFTIHFITPTFFKKKEERCLFPYPNVLLGSLSNRMPWPLLYPSPLPDIRGLNHQLYPTLSIDEYQLETIPLILDAHDNDFRIGFIGRFDYSIKLLSNNPLRRHLNILLMLMPFLGAGYKTPKGYGGVNIALK